MTYWPGTNIRKSTNNAFTEWRYGRSKITNSTEWRMSQASSRQNAGAGTDPRKQFTVYSKARQMK